MSTATDTVTSQLANGLTCELPADSPLAKLLKSQRTWIGPSAKERLAILRKAKSIAIVGASPNPTRSSYFVGTYLLQSSDYRVYFVNPMADEILGQKAYKSLADLPEVPDIVDVFPQGQRYPVGHRRGHRNRREDRVGAARNLESGCRDLRREQGSDHRHGPLHQDRARPIPRRTAPAGLRHGRDHLSQDRALVTSCDRGGRIRAVHVLA